MIKSTLILFCGICMLESVLTESLFKNRDVYEGNECQLRNGGGKGVCKKILNCPGVLNRIRSGNYRNFTRCGFSNFEEIVCCAIRVAPKMSVKKLRPANAACKRYKKMVSELEEDTFVYAVVFNGERAKLGEYPHMAALGYVASGDEEDVIKGKRYVCGGTLISQRHVITAAHCVHNVHGLVPVEVLLGTVDLTNPESGGMRRIPISRITKHPEYRRGLHYHDVAILELRDNVEFSAYIKPTCLSTKPSSNLTSSPSIRLDVLGWGAIDLDGTRSTRLLKATGLRFVQRNQCSKSYEYTRGQIPNGLDPGMICAVDANSTRKADTCWGDSGGPLLISGGTFRPLVGITSFGQACGGTTPGVYASVNRYLNWIEEQVWPVNSD